MGGGEREQIEIRELEGGSETGKGRKGGEIERTNWERGEELEAPEQES